MLPLGQLLFLFPSATGSASYCAGFLARQIIQINRITINKLSVFNDMFQGNFRIVDILPTIVMPFLFPLGVIWLHISLRQAVDGL